MSEKKWVNGEGLNGACAVCGRALDWWSDADGSNGHFDHTYQDMLTADHMAVWTPEESIFTAYRCDFCNVNTPTFSLPAEDFPYPHVPGAQSIGEWLACGTCAPMISVGDWNALAERVITVSPMISADIASGEITKMAARQFATTTYRALRKHITGPLEPFNPPTPATP